LGPKPGFCATALKTIARDNIKKRTAGRCKKAERKGRIISIGGDLWLPKVCNNTGMIRQTDKDVLFFKAMVTFSLQRKNQNMSVVYL
jgi:hypothetical protein